MLGPHHDLVCLALICLATGLNGLELTVQHAVSDNGGCGLLRCVDQSQTNYSSRRTIVSMAVFRQLTELEINKTQDLVLVAQVTSERLRVEEESSNVMADGSVSADRAKLDLYLTSAEDCLSDYTCEVRSLDTNGQEILNSVHISSRPNVTDNEILLMSKSLLLDLVHNINERLDGLETCNSANDHSQSLSSCVKGSHVTDTKYVKVYDKDDVPHLCDTATDNGGWIVIQRRVNGHTNFYQDWETYKKGFGSLDSNFWLGNDRIHQLTMSGTYELRVEVRWKGRPYFAHYSYFYIEEESRDYSLHLGKYSGDAGDSMLYHDGKPFSTFDKDNDFWSNNCAVSYVGAWWFNSCHNSNLNGLWGASGNAGLRWNSLTGQYSVEFSEMKIRLLE